MLWHAEELSSWRDSHCKLFGTHPSLPSEHYQKDSFYLLLKGLDIFLIQLFYALASNPREKFFLLACGIFSSRDHAHLHIMYSLHEVLLFSWHGRGLLHNLNNEEVFLFA